MHSLSSAAKLSVENQLCGVSASTVYADLERACFLPALPFSQSLASRWLRVASAGCRCPWLARRGRPRPRRLVDSALLTPPCAAAVRPGRAGCALTVRLAQLLSPSKPFPPRSVTSDCLRVIFSAYSRPSPVLRRPPQGPRPARGGGRPRFVRSALPCRRRRRLSEHRR